MDLRRATDFAKEMIRRFQEDEVTALGAQMTYYLILSFFPFLIFLITVISYTPIAREDVLQELFIMLPQSSFEMVKDIVNETVANKSETLLSIGMIATIWAASRGVMAVIKGINKAYDEAESRPFWKVRGIAIIYTLILAVVILITFVLVVFGRLIGSYIFVWLNYSSLFDQLWGVLKYLIPITVMILVFIYLYHSAPNRKTTFREVIPGAFFSTGGWIVTSLLFSFYINHFGSYDKTYGSIGGIIILLLWMYLSNIIIILGGEINAALAFLREGRKRKSSKNYGATMPFLDEREQADYNKQRI